jgi:hypothetical protein
LLDEFDFNGPGKQEFLEAASAFDSFVMFFIFVVDLQDAFYFEDAVS